MTDKTLQNIMLMYWADSENIIEKIKDDWEVSEFSMYSCTALAGEFLLRIGIKQNDVNVDEYIEYLIEFQKNFFREVVINKFPKSVKNIISDKCLIEFFFTYTFRGEKYVGTIEADVTVTPCEFRCGEAHILDLTKCDK